MCINYAFYRLLNMLVAKFISNVFLVAIFDATFADQILKSDGCVLISIIF